MGVPALLSGDGRLFLELSHGAFRTVLGLLAPEDVAAAFLGGSGKSLAILAASPPPHVGGLPTSAALRLLEGMPDGSGERALAASLRGLAGEVLSRDLDACCHVWNLPDAATLSRLGPEGGRRMAAMYASPALRRIRPPQDSWCEPVVQAMALRPRASRRAATETEVARFVATGPEVASAAMLTGLLSLPQDWWPRDPTEVDAARRLTQDTAPLASLLGHADFLRGVGGRWAAYRTRVADDAGTSLMASSLGALDMVAAFEREVVIPAMLREGLADPWPPAGHDRAPPPGRATSRAIAAAMLLGDKALPAILRMSARWHRFPTHSDAPVGPDPGWPVPFEALRAPCGTVLACLPDPASLMAEGSRGTLDGRPGLAHCAGSLADACRLGESVVVGVRAADGRRISTVELSGAGTAHEVRQHLGHGNAQPPPEAVEAVTWLRRVLADGTVVPSEAFRTHPWPRSAAREWRDARRFARAVDRWSPLLPRPLRGVPGTLRGLHAEADRIVRAEVPGGWAALPAGRLVPPTLPYARPRNEGLAAWPAAAGASARVSHRFRDPPGRFRGALAWVAMAAASVTVVEAVLYLAGSGFGANMASLGALAAGQAAGVVASMIGARAVASRGARAVAARSLALAATRSREDSAERWGHLKVDAGTRADRPPARTPDDPTA